MYFRIKKTNPGPIHAADMEIPCRDGQDLVYALKTKTAVSVKKRGAAARGKVKISNIGPATFIELIGGLAFRAIRAINQFSYALFRATYISKTQHMSFVLLPHPQ